MALPLSGKVCIVTGASRGIGKGIALQLSEAGATVYITGRKKDTLDQTAQEVQSRGGKCIPVVCDSTEDEDIKLLFDRVQREQKGRLDILVNNAFAGVQAMRVPGFKSLKEAAESKINENNNQANMTNHTKPFWETPPTYWDDFNNAGLRGHYICSVYAARMMVPAQHGLIVVISSIGGLMYIFNVPNGVGKEACDRLAADCATELRKHRVAYVSLWPGAVLTETMEECISKMDPSDPQSEKFRKTFSQAETAELSGKCIVSLATDRHLMKLSGKVLLTCEVAKRYGLQDINGRTVAQFTSLRNLLSFFPPLAWLSRFIPGFIRVPKWILTLSANKF
uniref:Dehydrogenase/reductase SDR family member 1-like isoform X1 n=1 Tax=Geotrypetes seraphini TaxID=260995 RepID=A0A6P8SFZ4_GEOSA|nr:dehydrogenase/reductase SDR family member 1-like isoform X1 [Geotrypetes seraphini]XP_033817786.1 dehydrogenase/reductase SDR family member 1-like isoform X1 [Geotrypetes seraphini]